MDIKQSNTYTGTGEGLIQSNFIRYRELYTGIRLGATYRLLLYINPISYPEEVIIRLLIRTRGSEKGSGREWGQLEA